MNDRTLMWIMIQFGVIVFSAGGAFFMLRQLRKEVSSQWLKIDKFRSQINQLNLGMILLAQTANPHPNESVLKICKSLAKENGG